MTQKGNWKDHLVTKIEDYDCSGTVEEGKEDDDFASSVSK